MLLSALSLRSRFAQLAVAATVLLTVLWFLLPSSFGYNDYASDSPLSHRKRPRPKDSKPKASHPIDHLVQQADKDFNSILAQESQTVEEAARSYRLRRGRQPPPGFDLWFEYASNNDAIIIENFFDSIYHDLNPFWGVPARQIREQAHAFPHNISVRHGKAEGHSDMPDQRWTTLWSDMVNSVADFLPDVDIPINVMDESRIVVPWEEINEYMVKEQSLRKVVPADKLKTKFGTLNALDTSVIDVWEPHFEREGPYWQLAVVGCPPDSPARHSYLDVDFSRPPPLKATWPEGSFEGYVQNWTYARSPCQNPNLQGLHGSFVEPISIATTQTLFPLFGGSKLEMNNEILMPPPMYWTNDPFYSGGDDHGRAWDSKADAMIWRGVASGGRNRENNWTRFQRHRFVAMVNATSVELAAMNPANPAINFILPDTEAYSISARATTQSAPAFGDWIGSWSDASMVNLVCFPEEDPPQMTCPYTDSYFSVTKQLPMEKQYAFKYLPDIDGNSFSGRYRGFLGSTSLPIKATIYREWHDSRLLPWKHFVPMDNSFIDIYGIMEYFIGNPTAGVDGHDEVAEAIAMAGKDWAEKVLRKEDMSIYVFRLLLEYARLCDDNREVMGWAETSSRSSKSSSGAELAT